MKTTWALLENQRHNTEVVSSLASASSGLSPPSPTSPPPPRPASAFRIQLPSIFTRSLHQQTTLFHTLSLSMHLNLSAVLAVALFGAAVQAHGLDKRRQDVHRSRAAAIERRQERPEDIMRCPLPTTVTATVTVTASADFGKPSQPVLLANSASTRAIISVESLIVEKPTSSVDAAPRTSSTSSASSKASLAKETVPTSANTSKNTSGRLSSYKGKTRGDATFYGTDYKGHNCGLPRKDLRFVAWPEVTYGTADHCGACLRVTGPAGTEVVQVTDKVGRTTFSLPLTPSADSPSHSARTAPA